MVRTRCRRHVRFMVMLSLALAVHAVDGQETPQPEPTPWRQRIEGLYRIEDTSSRSTRRLRYLRLLPDGTARTETIRIEEKGQRLTAVVEAPEVHSWYLHLYMPDGSPQLCMRGTGPAECYWMRLEMPSRDLHLYNNTAELGSPTVVLRRHDDG